jgi:antitoxin (DNA-binding transcriptional repressor) of toxin-antitoxin stability system
VNVTITHLRQNLLKLIDSVLKGEVLEFTHKGVMLRIVPEVQPSKLARLPGKR